MDYHIPVLLQSVLHYLHVQPNSKYIDATFGGGGHSTAIIAAGGIVLGIDQDPEAISACPPLDGSKLIRGNFIHLKEIAQRTAWLPVAGILYDLGVSSHQINTPGRGFSFQHPGPLDMRMDPDLPNTAATLVNILDAKHLAELFIRFGEISGAARIARNVVSRRPYSTTQQLAAVIPDIHTRRLVFQALRIAVNDELTALSISLPQALSLLSPGGRLVVISFHSLEDRIVKQFFRDWERQNLGIVLTPNPVIPDDPEISANPRSHSAKLRVFQKK